MEADIKRLARRKDGDDSDDESQSKKKAKSGPSALQQELAKYRTKAASKASAAKGKKRDDSDMLRRLEKFRSQLKLQPAADGDGDEDDDMADGENAEEGLDVDNDSGWMGHRLNFPTGNEEEVSRAEHDYEVIDPRTRGAAARQEEMDRKRAKKSNVGSAFRRGR